MKNLIVIITLILPLSSCAQTPEQAAAYRQFGMQMLSQQYAQPQQQMQPVQPRNMTCNRVLGQVQCRQW